MVKVCEKEFPKGTFPYQKDDGFPMNPTLKIQLDYYLQNVDNDWDFTIVICGEGEVRVGKTILPESSIKVVENGKIIDKEIKEFYNGQKIITVSWDFKNNKQIFSESEVIVENEEKNLYEVVLENGKKIICSLDHKLFVKRNDNVIEVKLKFLKEGDELICKKN